MADHPFDDRLSVEVSQVSALIRLQAPHWSDLEIRPVVPGGWDNRTFRLGQDKVVRMPSADRYAEQVPTEHLWLPLLANTLDAPVPKPLFKGKPGFGYPFEWSINTWLAGQPAANADLAGSTVFACDCAAFLNDLQGIPSKDGPKPSQRNFFRGGDLEVYHAETLCCLEKISDAIDAKAARAMWERALASHWAGPDKWVHGDFASGNILTDHTHLSAVIDFGCMAVGDPTCDLTICWTYLKGPARPVFQHAINLEGDVWERAAGWAVWKAASEASNTRGVDPVRERHNLEVIADVLNDPHLARV